MLWNPPSERPQITARIAAREIISASNFEIRLLKKSRPQQGWIASIDNMEKSISVRGGQSIIYDDSPPATIEVQTDNVLAIRRDDRSAKAFVKGPKDVGEHLNDVSRLSCRDCLTDLFMATLSSSYTSTQTGHNRTVSRSILHKIDHARGPHHRANSGSVVWAQGRWRYCHLSVNPAAEELILVG